jgi:hypothetical protein
MVDPTSTVIGQIALGGIPPAVSPVSLSGTPLVSGMQTVSWTVVSGTQARAIVQYSIDGGTTWADIGIVNGQTSLPVNFDSMPGSRSAGSSRIRVLVSDGANTSEGDSQPFTVSRKLPSGANIDLPAANDVFRRIDLVILRGSAYDADDGPLTEDALSWTSNINGTLGTGTELVSGTLSAGQHTVTMKATDSDGNSTSTTTRFVVSSGAPQAKVTFNAPGQNGNSSSCPWSL